MPCKEVVSIRINTKRVLKKDGLDGRLFFDRLLLGCAMVMWCHSAANIWMKQYHHTKYKHKTPLFDLKKNDL